MRTVGNDSNESNLPVHERSARQNARIVAGQSSGEKYEISLAGARRSIASAMQGGRGLNSAIHYAEAKTGITGFEMNKMPIESSPRKNFSYWQSKYIVDNPAGFSPEFVKSQAFLLSLMVNPDETPEQRAARIEKIKLDYKINFDASVKRIEQERRDVAVAKQKAREAAELARKAELANQMNARNAERRRQFTMNEAEKAKTKFGDSSEFDSAHARLAEFQRTSSAKFTADNAAIAATISNPAAAALQTSVAGTDTKVVPTTAVLPPTSSAPSTPSTGTSPLTIAAIGFGVLKLLAII